MSTTTITLTDQEKYIVIAGIIELLKNDLLTPDGVDVVDSLRWKLGIEL